ncbi:MAG: YggS family pyridoxal phosphate-dependent enzyme [Nitrospirae bacterium]|nr:YggS family pyridoxal phosphate-dependent enzyme [Nitrospirota bacterium]
MLIDNVTDILNRMMRAAVLADRSPDTVKLVAVTKKVEIEAIEEALDIGIRVFGENRVQEAKAKIEHFRGPGKDFTEKALSGVQWHLIGNLQKNKAKYAVHLFDLIHTMDSAGLAEEIDRQALKINKTQRVLVQVKLAGDETRHGVSEEKMMSLLKEISGMSNIQLEGLMTMPPFFDDPEQTRPYFRRLRELRDEAEKAGLLLPELSMGMSHDFEVAIQEGATMVRIGTALFGERSKQ